MVAVLNNYRLAQPLAVRLCFATTAQQSQNGKDDKDYGPAAGNPNGVGKHWCE